MDAVDWLMGDDTGISSRVIWCVANGRSVGNAFFGNHPHDPSDFGRCFRLLELFPQYRAYMPLVANQSSEWAELVGAWDELEALYREEVPNHSGMAPKLYARMKELIAAGERAPKIRKG